jgi:hypothetical protein
MGINTTGIKILPNCAIPNQLSVTSSNANSSTISATSVNGCSLRLSLNPNDAEQQYGVVNVPRCGTNTSDVAFQSVRKSLSSCKCVHGRFIPYFCLGFLLVLAKELEQHVRCFLPTGHGAFRRDRVCGSQQQLPHECHDN